MAAPRRAGEDASRDLAGSRILIVEARFYDDIADALLDGARTAITDAGADAEVITVPGALEIPIALSIALDAAEAEGRAYDGAVALGCVIRGETGHYDIVAGESARALMDLAIQRRLAFGNGILTVETDAQAWARARVSEMNKGGGAAEAALAIIRLKRKFNARGNRS